MAKPLYASQLDLPPGSCVRVVVDILPDAKRFTIDLGINDKDIALHFNPRFNYLSCHRLVIFNTFHNGWFGKELRDSHFPFEKGTKAEIFIRFFFEYFLVRLSDGFEYHFPNRTEVMTINNIKISGDILVRTLSFV